MSKYIVVVELTDAEINDLQAQVSCGSATGLEKKMYNHIYHMNEQDRAESVAKWL